MKNFILLLTLTFSFATNSSSQCEPTFNFYQWTCDFDCAMYLENMPYNPNLNYDNAVLWNFGDGIVENGDYYSAQHQYTQPGTYTVTAEILVGECEGMIYSYDFTVEGCNCPTEMTTVMTDTLENYLTLTQCSSYQFTLGGNDFVYYFSLNNSMEWDFGDGTTFSGVTDQAQHSYMNEGEYIVSCTFTGENCEVTLTDTVNVAFCEGNCLPGEYFYYESYGEDCNVITLVMDFDPNTQWFVDDEYIGQGYIVEAILENGIHNVCMVLEPQESCPNGSEFCTEIEISCDNDCTPPDYIEAIQSEDNCFLWEFEIGDYVSGMSVNWDMGDGTIYIGGINYQEHTYSEPGVYTITATFQLPFCPEQTTFYQTITVLDCEEDCSVNVLEISEDCFTVLEAITSGPGTLDWYIDGLFYSNEEIIQIVDEGEHDYCVIFTPIDCNYITESCNDFSVECSNSCPTLNDFYAGSMGEDMCYWWEFEIGEFNQNAEITWNFGDGIIETWDQSYASHPYANSGTYVVTALYSSNTCPDGVELQQVIEVNCPDCYLDIEYYQENCNSFTFESLTNPEDENAYISWIIDDEYIADGSSLAYVFEEEGSHTVCAVTESGICFMETCITVEVENCNEDCTPIDFAIDSNVNEGGPEGINWMVYNFNDNTVGESGVCQFDSETMYCDPTVCLPDGCYQMVIYVGEGYDWTGITSFPTIEGAVIDIYNVSTSCDCGILTYDFSINSDCGEDACYLDIQSENVGDGSFIFEANAPDNANVEWTMGDGTILNGSVVDYQYTTPGTYEVCAYYETENCPEGIEACTSILVEESNCTEVTISINANINDTQLELIQFYLMNEGFEYNGTIPFTSLNGGMEMTFCIPDGCYDFNMVPSDGLFDLLDLTVTASIDGNVVASLENVVGTEPSTMVIPVNTTCTSSVNEETLQAFEYYPNPANNKIFITNICSQVQQISIYNNLGQLVLNQPITPYSDEVDVSQLPSGSYQMVLSGEYEIKFNQLKIVR